MGALLGGGTFCAMAGAIVRKHVRGQSFCGGTTILFRFFYEAGNNE
jgi:hypothetical protein